MVNSNYVVPVYTPSLDELRTEVDAALDVFLQDCALSLEDNRPLIAELRRMIAAGGKRLRPAFCYWAFRAGGGAPSGPIVRAAGSLELLHTFALVHDDIMDASDERRGEPTVHALHGVSVGVLAGDLALVLADSCLLGAGFDLATMKPALAAYQVMRQEVIAGQYLDVLASGDPAIGESEARRIALLKSGRYSIEKPLVIGARLAGAPESLVAGLSHFGELVGEAFQYRDDVLGTFGDRAEVGKPIDSDIREGKRHLLYARTVAALSGRERDFFTTRWGGRDALSSEDVETLRLLIEKSGARASVEADVDGLAGRARESLGQIELHDDVRTALLDLTEQAVRRAL